MKRNIPGTAREIVESLINEYGYSVKRIAEMLGITSKTVYRIRKGYLVLPKIHLNLIHFYLHVGEESFEESKERVE